ncbi:MAG: type II toxin-antitoxin system HicA family toxin [Clostridiales bacterium]|nr:type II toxin-antitoxin system HicA family toxin [Clostridiales bacterium]
MSKFGKLENRIRSLSNDICFEEIKTYLEHYGFQISTTGGSHFVFRNQGERVVISGKKRHVAKYQVKQALEAVNRIAEKLAREE